MPRSQHHPLALFSLKPINGRAHDVLAHPCNIHLVSTLSDGAPILDIGFNIRSKSCDTLATLGRGDTDIFVEGSSIAKVQCSFEIDLDSGVIMLYDRSNNLTTQVFGDNARPFEHGRCRRVVVQANLNTMVGMGGVGCDLVQFMLIWYPNPTQTIGKVKSLEYMPCGQDENPRFARTVDEAPTVSLSQRAMRIHTLGERNLRIRYEKVGSPLGSGQFGVVYKCIDVDLGKFMAVKVLTRPPGKSQEGWRETLRYTLKHEVETLSNINHPHIVDYIASQGWDSQSVEIFMGLKEGTLESIVESGDGLPASVANSLFPQMLQALDCLAYNGIVHRDVKPENILYVSQPGGQYQFQLEDFGLCNRVIDAVTFAGSCLYMAPEVLKKEGQTSKLDVWSLFVTMLWTLDVGGFRQRSNQFKSIGDVQEAVLHAALNNATISKIREMAVVDPEERASAAQMLVKHYNGAGLSTPQDQVPALINSPALALPALTTRATRTKPRIFRKSRNIFGFATPHRVEKARDPSSSQQAPRRLYDLRPKPDKS
ncbi:kinase-like domain-containing protein [Phaeosphaeriaceae sp. PMI808]|nr:kinase-like domain-containing protein [Phaeosphaeriaceae sp. PMI808]